MILFKLLALSALALFTTACSAVIYPLPVVTYHPAPVYQTHTVVYPEIYYFHNRPVVVHRHHQYYTPHPHWRRW